MDVGTISRMDIGFYAGCIMGPTKRRKGAQHPHTNMAKASLNMMTCSVADEFSRAGVAVVSVDTGWISKMKLEGR